MGRPITNRTCMVIHCNKKHMAKGYCDTHYSRLLRNGDPLKAKHNFYHEELCMIIECSNKYYGKGLCKHHWTKKNRQRMNIKQYERLIKKSKSLGLTKNEYNGALMGWSDYIRKRDNNQCKICGSSKNLHAHHIFHKKLYPLLQFNLNNGITLCKNCHWESHRFKL